MDVRNPARRQLREFGEEGEALCLSFHFRSTGNAVNCLTASLYYPICFPIFHTYFYILIILEFGLTKCLSCSQPKIPGWYEFASKEYFYDSEMARTEHNSNCVGLICWLICLGFCRDAERRIMGKRALQRRRHILARSLPVSYFHIALAVR